MRRVHEALAAGLDGSLTTSVGWATFPEDGASADALLNLADGDLRRTKRTPAPRRENRGHGGRKAFHATFPDIPARTPNDSVA